MPVLACSFAASICSSIAALPAGGALPTPGLGVGSGSTTPYVAGTAAAASSVKITSSAGWIDLPNVTLNPSGDWAIFISTISPSNEGLTGTILSIGTASNTLFKDPAHLSLSWCGRYGGNPWANTLYPKTFTVTGRDDTGKNLSGRLSTNNGDSSFYGMPIDSSFHALVSQQVFADNKAYGLVIQRRAGVVELWAVDRTGARFMDSSGSLAAFAGITNKPFRIGAALMVTQPSTPATYWKQSMQALVVYNGGTLSAAQMQRLYDGGSAQSVLTLQAGRDDRYYPGSIASGTLTELVGGKHGTPGTILLSTWMAVPSRYI